jgi:hypothetical protein
MKKLTESQAESLELLYANISNGLLYAEDLLKTDMRETMSAFVTKLRWLKTAMELRLPPEKRKLAREKDHLFYDELLRCATHMTDEQKNKLEKFINDL